MATTMTEETLMAYVDGELDADTRAAVETAMASDPDVARRVARQQVLRQKLRATFDGVLDEAVPDRLIATARDAPAGSPDSKVSDLSRARTERDARFVPRWSWPQWGAMAASLILGMLLGQALWRAPASGPIVARDGRLIAQEALDEALSSQLASKQPLDAQIGMGLSFRSKSGEYCRTFMVREGRGLAGIACREGDVWAVQVIAPDDSPGSPDGGYRMAGAELPVLVLQAVEERIEGDPLDANAEAAARESGWR